MFGCCAVCVFTRQQFVEGIYGIVKRKCAKFVIIGGLVGFDVLRMRFMYLSFIV